MLKSLVSLTRPKMRVLVNSYLFAKQKSQKPQKAGGGGKKQQGGGGAIVFTPKIPDQDIMKQYLKSTQNMLSEKELQIMNEGFGDLSDEEKKMIQGFADRILELRTPAFLEFIKWGGLGTGDSMYVATSQKSDEQLSQSLTFLKKQDN